MKRQKFTVHYEMIISVEEVVEASSYEEALSKATDLAEGDIVSNRV